MSKPMSDKRWGELRRDLWHGRAWDRHIQSKIADEVDRLRGSNEALLSALEDSLSFHFYCGWGGEWTRECAMEEGLPEKIEAAIAKAKGQTNDPA